MPDYLKMVRKAIFDGKDQSFLFIDGDERNGMKTNAKRTAEIDEEINAMTNVELLDAMSNSSTRFSDIED